MVQIGFDTHGFSLQPSLQLALTLQTFLCQLLNLMAFGRVHKAMSFEGMQGNLQQTSYNPTFVRQDIHLLNLIAIHLIRSDGCKGVLLSPVEHVVSQPLHNS